MSQATKVKLLPCPFRHTAEQKKRPFAPYASDALSEDSNWCVTCPVCFATTGFYDTREQAKAAWQARAFPSEADRELLVKIREYLALDDFANNTFGNRLQEMIDRITK